jgi:hypothetical protein
MKQNTNTWKTENPPKDGSPIIAIGSVISTHAWGGTSVPFLHAIVWKVQGDFKGWCHCSYPGLGSPCDGLTVAESPDDMVTIYLWLECPPLNFFGHRSAAEVV